MNISNSGEDRKSHTHTIRGFAVVARQVKELAERVSTSTKTIAERLGTIQRESTDARGVILAGANSVDRGVDISSEAGTSLEETTRAARDSGDRVTEIVTTVQEQSRAIAFVAGLMDQLHTRALRGSADSNEESVRRLDEATRSLEAKAEELGEFLAPLKRA